MKRSQFVAVLVVLAIVQIGVLTVFHRWESEKSDRGITAVEAAEADAAQVFSRALVSELQQDPDYTLRERLLGQAKLRATAVLRQSSAEPSHILLTLTKLDEIANGRPLTTGYSENWTERPQRQQHARRQHTARQPRAGPELSESEKLMRELDSQVVPKYIDDIGRPPDNRVTRRERHGQPF